MGKIKFYVAASLDGFLSDQNGGVDWLMPFQNVPYDYGYADFIKNMGYIVSGSKTYEQAKEFPGGWNFPNTHSYIFTSRDLDTDGRDDIVLWPKPVAEIIPILREKEKDTWLLGGAKLAGNFFNEKGVDELILSIMPLVLGKGLPLFEGISREVPMALLGTESFPNGVVQLKYKVG